MHYIGENFNNEMVELLESTLPNANDNIDTVILKLGCGCKRENLTLETICGEMDNNKNILVKDILDEDMVKQLLPLISDEYESKKRKRKFIESLEQARDINKLKRAIVHHKLESSLLEKAHKEIFSVHQSYLDMGEMRQQRLNGVADKQLREMYINTLIANEIKFLIYYFTHNSNNLDFSKDIVEQIQKYPISIRSKKIEPLLRVVLSKLYQKEKVFIFTDEVNNDNESVILGVLIDKEYFMKHKEIFEQDNTYSRNDYKSYVLQVINVTLEKWRDIIKYRFTNTTCEYIMDNNATLHLAARDITEGRNLPSYHYYNLLSSIPYEGAVCMGQIVFWDKMYDQDKLIRFERTIAFTDTNIRYIRKILEISKGKYYIVCYKGSIIGITKLTSFKMLHILRFNGFMKWALEYSGIQIVSYDKGRFFYNFDTYSKQIEDIPQSEELKQLIRKFCEQKHGTMVIIFKDRDCALREVNRLSEFERGVQLNPPYKLAVEEDIILQLSAIDGAIVIDENCMCYGIGMIVDGEACVNGTASRGARYNSGNNYVKNMADKKVKCSACVISEDGMLDVISYPIEA